MTTNGPCADEPPFHTQRLTLECWSLDHAAEAATIYGDPEVMRYIGDGKVFDTPDVMRTRIGETLQRNRRWKGRMGSWPFREKETGALVGAVLLKPIPDHEEIEVGWHLARKAWGNGYATEAGRAAIDYGFNTLKLEEIWAVVDLENERSKSVCRRLGMAHLGRTNRYYGRVLELFVIRPNQWNRLNA